MKGRKIAGWIFAGLGLASIIMSIFPKILMDPQAVEGFAAMNLPPVWIFGVLEIIFVVLYFVPRTRTLGFALLSAYLGGAIAINFAFSPQYVLFAVLPTVFLWIGTAFLHPSLLQKNKD